MKENEALKTLEDLQRLLTNYRHISKDLTEANGIAIKAIEELEQYRAIGTVEQLQKSVKEEDILKFYYIESEDKYVVGQRVDTLYYAEVGKTGLAFYMSRYLPWGEHVVAPDTLWKEHTYPSEPKEIPFFDWLQGFMKKEYGGTIEEFKDLKEKSAAKKPNEIERKRDDYGFIYQIVKCPCCGKLVTDDRECCDCMQKLDWSE